MPSIPEGPVGPGGPGGPGINHFGSIYADGAISFVSVLEVCLDFEPDDLDFELEQDELELDELDEQVDSVSLAQEVSELFNGPSPPQHGERERDRERERLLPRPRLCLSGYT